MGKGGCSSGGGEYHQIYRFNHLLAPTNWFRLHSAAPGPPRLALIAGIARVWGEFRRQFDVINDGADAPYPRLR